MTADGIRALCAAAAGTGAGAGAGGGGNGGASAGAGAAALRTLELFGNGGAAAAAPAAPPLPPGEAKAPDAATQAANDADEARCVAIEELLARARAARPGLDIAWKRGGRTS